MLQYIIKRTLMILPILLGVIIIVFTIINAVPGDPGRRILGVGRLCRRFLRHSYIRALDSKAFQQFARQARAHRAHKLAFYRILDIELEANDHQNAVCWEVIPDKIIHLPDLECLRCRNIHHSGEEIR